MASSELTATAPTIDDVRPCVLVAYATRFGSTRGVAERIAAQLAAADHRVELSVCGQVTDLSPYSAVVIGSPVFNQRWLPEADDFLERHRESLVTRSVWLFSVGTFGDDKPLIGAMMKREPRNIPQLTAAVHPIDYRVFAGVIDRHQWPLGSRIFYHALGGRLGDNRNWAAIDAWGASISRTLLR